MSDQYVPGVCNIGGSEVANRRRIGHVSLLITVALAAAMIALGAPPLTLLLLALPAFVMSTGYLQAKHHFCAGYGAAGMSNFGDDRSSVVTHEVAEHVAADKARAKRITLQAVALGVVVALVAVAIAAAS